MIEVELLELDMLRVEVSCAVLGIFGVLEGGRSVFLWLFLVFGRYYTVFLDS